MCQGNVFAFSPCPLTFINGLHWGCAMCPPHSALYLPIPGRGWLVAGRGRLGRLTQDGPSSLSPGNLELGPRNNVWYGFTCNMQNLESGVASFCPVKNNLERESGDNKWRLSGSQLPEAGPHSCLQVPYDIAVSALVAVSSFSVCSPWSDRYCGQLVRNPWGSGALGHPST